MIRFKEISILCTLVLLIVIRPATSRSDDSECLDCHEDVADVINESFYVHEPVRDKKCRVCHARQDVEETEPVQPVAEPVTNFVVAYKNTTSAKQEPITWLLENFTPSRYQAALISPRQLEDRLILELWQEQSGKKKRQFETPKLEDLEAQNPLYQMLSIDNIYLTEFDTRLVPRASLHWTTNEPGRCTVSYGNERPDVIYEEDDLYVYDHHLHLRNFTDKGYVVEIKCRDPYRRLKNTEHFNILSLPVLKNEQEAAIPTKDRVRLKNLQDKLWVEVETTQPASLSVGVQRVADDESDSALTEPTITLPEPVHETDDDEHIVLNTLLYTTTQVCHKCHTGLEPGQSHPVNVLPPLNMTVPPEYKRLKNGKITCMTCHTIHGGNTENRLIKKTPKALCTGCHTNY